MKLGPVIKQMTAGQARQELARVRALLRTFFELEDHQKCWRAEQELRNRVFRDEPPKPIGRMHLPKAVLLKGCARYIDRQQCAAGCSHRRAHGHPRPK